MHIETEGKARITNVPGFTYLKEKERQDGNYVAA